MPDGETVAEPRPDPSPKRWSLVKIGSALLAAVLIFGAGFASGKGNLHLGSSNTASINSGLPPQLDYSSVDKVYQLLKSDYDGNLKKDQLTQGLKAGLVAATGDPYTQYFNPAQAKDFNEELAGSFTGIGAELGGDSDGHIVIVSPLAGYPAEQAGLKPKDIVGAIDGQPTSGMSIDSAVHKIRGPAGSKITLTIIRGSVTPFDVTITRAKISLQTVKYSVDGNIGYLKISQFSDDTVKLAQQAASEFKNKNVKGVVLDLRGDPGGFLSGAVDISSMWLDKSKTVVQERRGNTVQSTEYASGNNPFHGLPTVVLIDGGSASASEITAGALRDNSVAILVGVKSFGKGSVQRVVNLDDGSEVKLTIAHWYTPAGKNIDKQGISPDIEVRNSDADVKAGHDAQKDKAYQLLQQKIQL